MGNNQNEMAVERFRSPMRVFVLGATGTVGRATVAALVATSAVTLLVKRARYWYPLAAVVNAAVV